MKLWNSYYRAKNLEDALATLAGSSGSVEVIAGGTDLLLDMQQGRHDPVDLMVDVTAIPEMKLLELRGQELFIGASVPINKIVRSPLVAEHAQAVVEACDLIGGPQVRNTATLGGNVAHALPAADGTIALLAMGAEVEIAAAGGSYRAPIEDLFLGPGKSSLKKGHELLLGFYLPQRLSGQASAFRRVMRPQGVALPILNMACWVWRERDLVKDIRLTAGPSGPTPRQSTAAEKVLRGSAFNLSLVPQAYQVMLGEARFRTSPLRATSTYRQHLAYGLLEEVLIVAWERTG